MKKSKGLIIALCLILSVVGIVSAAPKKWRAGLVVARPHPWFNGLDYFAEKVKEISKGDIEVVIYPSGQLGNENVMLSSIGDRSLDLFIGGLSTCSAYSGKVGFGDIGRLFEGQAHFEKAMNYGGPVDVFYRNLLEGVGANFKILAFTGGGVKNYSSRKPVRHLKDIAGMKMRVPNDPVAANFWAAMGALPVSMAFTEIYTALQTGVVDSFDSSVPSYYASKLYEVAPYHNITEHTFMMSVFLMRKDVFDKLSPEIKKAVHNAGIEAGLVTMKAGVDETKNLLEELRKKGVKLIEVDKESFRTAAIPVQNEIAAKIGVTQLLDEVRALGKEK